mgnify:CR=1 FL=1
MSPTTRTEKARRTEALAARLREVKAVYLADFTGLDVGRLTALRRRLREAGAELVVVKNTLARRAVQGLDFPELAEFLRGPTALVLGAGDPVAPARVLREFALENENRPAVRAAWVERSLVSGDEVRALAQMPPREELLAAIAGGLTAGVAGIAGALEALLRDLALLIEEVARTRGAGGAATADPDGAAGSAEHRPPE